MKEKIVFTGLGVFSSAGRRLDEFYQNLSQGRCFIKKLEKVRAEKFKTYIGAEIEKLDSVDKEVMPLRDFRKLAEFCKYGVISYQEAMSDASLDQEKYDSYKVGMLVGNCYGGMEFSESELIHLNKEGVKNISSYLAVAWFPTAIQGQVSIKNTFLGYSKTYVCDRISGSWALYDTALKLSAGVLDLAFCGGSEGIHSSFGNLCLSTRTETIDSYQNHNSVFAPFSTQAAGSAIGEGACFFSMERQRAAQQRGAKTYGTLAACEINNDLTDNPMVIDGDYQNYKIALQKSLESAQLDPEDVDCIIPSAIGTANCDRKEYAVLKEVFGQKLETIPVSIPKTMFGDTLGASSSFDVLCGLLMMDKKVIFPSVNMGRLADDIQLKIFPTAFSKEIKNVLILNRGAGGNNSAIVLKKN